jgi:hypothetical protein
LIVFKGREGLKRQRVSNSTLVLFAVLMAVLIVFVLRYLPLLTYVPPPAELSPVQPAAGVTSEASVKEALNLRPVADPFSLRVPVSKIGAGEGAQGEVSPSTAVYVPQNTWELGGIWVTKGLKYALIGDDSVAEGEEINGWRVQKITANSVTLTKGSETKLLRLEE